MEKGLIEKYVIYKKHIDRRQLPINMEPYLTDFLRELYGERIHEKQLESIAPEQKYCIAKKAAEKIIKEIKPTQERIDLLELILTVKQHPEKAGLSNMIQDRITHLPTDLAEEFLKIKQDYQPEQLKFNFQKSKAY